MEQPSAIRQASLTLLIDSAPSLASPSCSLNNRHVSMIFHDLPSGLHSPPCHTRYVTAGNSLQCTVDNCP